MQRVIVTVKRKNEVRVRDLEVPSDMQVSRLAEMIARALRWDTDLSGKVIQYQIEAQPLGRILQPSESLESAGVLDGSWLVFDSPDLPAPTSTKPPQRSGGVSSSSAPSPTTGGRIRLLSDDSDQSSSPGEEGNLPDFKWKQLD